MRHNAGAEEEEFDPGLEAETRTSKHVFLIQIKHKTGRNRLAFPPIYQQYIYICWGPTPLMSFLDVPLMDTQRDTLWQYPEGTQGSASQSTPLPAAGPVPWISVYPLHHSTVWSPLPAVGTFSLPEQPVGTAAPNKVEQKQQSKRKN